MRAQHSTPTTASTCLQGGLGANGYVTTSRWLLHNTRCLALQRSGSFLLPSTSCLSWSSLHSPTYSWRNPQDSYHSKEAQEPHFPMKIFEKSFQLVVDQLAALDHTGPVGLNCDDTKLFACIGMLNNSYTSLWKE